MKITDIRTLSRAHEPERQWYSATFHVPKADCSICIIETDEGLQGIAEPCAYGVPPAIAARIAELKPSLIGRDPRDEDLTPHNEAVRANDIANAGLNCALWDLRGKIAGKPTADLLCELGQEPLRRLRLYASSGVRYDWDDHPESVVEEAIGYAEEGFTAYKMRLGTHWAWSGVTVDRFLKIARQVHEAVGARMDLALDGNCRLSMEEALPIAEALDEMGWAWFEEPVERVPADYARLNEAVSIPITGGEPFTTWAQFEPFMEVGGFGIVQPDAGVCGIDLCMAGRPQGPLRLRRNTADPAQLAQRPDDNGQRPHGRGAACPAPSRAKHAARAPTVGDPARETADRRWPLDSARRPGLRRRTGRRS